MAVGAFCPQIQAFLTVNEMCFFKINPQAFPPQLDMNTLAAITYAGFCYFPDTKGQ